MVENCQQVGPESYPIDQFPSSTGAYELQPVRAMRGG